MKLNLEVRLSIGGKEVYFKEHDGFCRAAGSHIRGWWHAVTGISVPDITNTSRDPGGSVFRVNGPSGNANYGPVVGTGTGAYDWDNYKLDTQIAHGAGAGQLQYGATTFNAPQTVGNERYYEIIRTFQNQSGGDITVNEIGLYATQSTATYYWCIARDVLGIGVTVPNGQTLTVTYKIKVTL
jgi:hypothetical protein